MGVLHAIEGPLRGRIFGIPERPRLIVGRYEIYDVVVPEPSISRKHFVLERRPDGIYIIDLGSLNGTQLNGLRISTAKLDHGDLIAVGQSVLCYDETDGRTPPVAVVQGGGIETAPKASAAAPAADLSADEPIEDISDADVVEITPEVGIAPTDEIVELPDEVVEVPDEIVELQDESPDGPLDKPLDEPPEEPPEEVLEEVPEEAPEETPEEAPAEVVALPDLETPPDPASAVEPPPTVPMDTSAAREAIRKRRLRTDIGKRSATRAAQKEEAARAAGGAEAGPSDSRRGSGRRRAGRAASSGRRPGPDQASPPPVASGPAVEKCVACGRAVSQEEIDAGEGANTRKGYLCGHCVDERQRSGIKGLEKFIRYRRKQKRGGG